MNLVRIDGSQGDGSGAVVRTALQMSCLTQMPVEINDIRSKTQYPGLDNEDLQIAFALAESTSADLEDATLNSRRLLFKPKRSVRALKSTISDVAGSQRKANALVVASTLAPVLARAGAYSSIRCSGETYGASSLTYDYFANVVLKGWQRAGLYCEAKLLQAGFSRESDGAIELDIEPSGLNSLVWSDRGQFKHCRCTIALCELPSLIGKRGEAHLQKLARHSGLQMGTEILTPSSARPGVFVTMWAEYERGVGGVAVPGAKGVRMESLVQTAFDQLTTFMAGKATIDSFCADHALIPAIMAPSDSIFSVPKLTPRLLGIIWVIKQFLPIYITVKGKEGEAGEIVIRRD